MSVKQTASIVFLGIFVLLIFNTFFSVHETRQAIVLQFGRPVGAPVTEPGLKLKCHSSNKFNIWIKEF